MLCLYYYYELINMLYDNIEVWGVMRRAACLRAEALRLCSALQEVGAAAADGAWAELLTAAAQRQHLDLLLRLHQRALERQCVHAIIHHSTQVNNLCLI